MTNFKKSIISLNHAEFSTQLFFINDSMSKCHFFAILCLKCWEFDILRYLSIDVSV
jgi:hypothetical protein